ncbi:MAG TPA: PilN domain-containing protein [Gammaproteobacteria bacterium]|nr:PilN domain-containing protein [Gammaproteobacteria bacterium]
MPKINLLPWRAELRQRRKKEFLVALLGTMMVGALLVYASRLTVQGWTSSQNNRNAVLREEIAALDEQITEIGGLETQRDRLLARMEIIDQLQRSRPEVVHLFDELVNTLPDGLHLTEVKQTEGRIEIHGSAQSSTRVSALMRNIDRSEWLREPGLDIVETVEAGPAKNAQFTMFAEQVSMAEETPGGSDAAQEAPQ